MNGCVITGTPIAVDFWKPTKAPQPLMDMRADIEKSQARLFFLTHVHADHTQGLSRTWRLPIYTSPTNAILLNHKFKLPKSIVKELEVNETYLIPLDDDGNYPMSVTVLDANHVPGAVMFLFQGYFGNILYCGDMRWYPELLEHKVLRNMVELRELDVIYLDNTFSAPYCVFPTREECKHQVFKIIDSFPDHIIKIGIRDLGRENLLEAVARRFQERILVSRRKFEILQLLQCSDVFTTNPEEARIHAVPLNQLQVATHNRWNQERPTISIILTALYVGWPNGPYSSQANSGIFVVPYSDHSSYNELMELVATLAPRRVMPIVQCWSKVGWWSDPAAPDQTVKKDMSVYDRFLTFPPPQPFKIPTAVANLMRAGAPMLLSHQPRRCVLRRGLAPRPRRTCGVVYSSPEPHVPLPVPLTPSPIPSSSITLDLSVRDSFKSHFQSNISTSTPTKILAASVSSPSSKKQLFAQDATAGDKKSHSAASSTISMKANLAPNSGSHTVRIDSNKHVPSEDPQSDKLTTRGDSNMSLNDKRSHFIAHTTTLISNECALLKNDKSKVMKEDEMSRLLENTKAICEAIAVVNSLF